jgi:hypothetical protein
MPRLTSMASSCGRDSRFKDICNDIRNNYNIKDGEIPSGKQLRDIYKSHLMKMYKEANVSLLFVTFFDYYIDVSF